MTMRVLIIWNNLDWIVPLHTFNGARGAHPSKITRFKANKVQTSMADRKVSQKNSSGKIETSCAEEGLSFICLQVKASVVVFSQTIFKKKKFARNNKQREIGVLDRQGTQQQRPESPMVTPPGVYLSLIHI